MSNPLPSFIYIGATVTWKHTTMSVKVADLSRAYDEEPWIGMHSGNVRYPITWLKLDWLADPKAPRQKAPKRARPVNESVRAEPSRVRVHESGEDDEEPVPAMRRAAVTPSAPVVRARATVTIQPQ